MSLEFSGEIWFWKGPAPWYFVTVPAQECEAIKAVSGVATYGWGMIPVTVQVGNSRWTTSLFPKDESYIVPIKARIRTKEKLAEGDEVMVQLEIRS